MAENTAPREPSGAHRSGAPGFRWRPDAQRSRQTAEFDVARHTRTHDRSRSFGSAL